MVQQSSVSSCPKLKSRADSVFWLLEVFDDLAEDRADDRADDLDEDLEEEFRELCEEERPASRRIARAFGFIAIVKACGEVWRRIGSR